MLKKGNGFKFKVYNLLDKREEAILNGNAELVKEYNDIIFSQNKHYEDWMYDLETKLHLSSISIATFIKI